MEIAEQSRFEATNREVRSYDAAIMFAYAFLTITLLIAIYLAAMSPGTSVEQLVSMTVFP